MGVDFLQSIFGGTGKVHRVGRPQVNRGREPGISPGHSRNDRGRKGEPMVSAAGAVPFKRAEGQCEVPLAQGSLTQLAVESGGGLGLAVQATDDPVGSGQ